MAVGLDSNTVYLIIGPYTHIGVDMSTLQGFQSIKGFVRFDVDDCMGGCKLGYWSIVL